MPTIIARSGWRARAPRSGIPTTTWSKRTGFAIHHSGGNTATTARQIQDDDMDKDGFMDVGYNWMVKQDGTIYEGRFGNWLAIGAHAGGQNTAWIGVCWIGHSGNVQPSDEALASIKWLYQKANQLAGRTLMVRGHGQVPGQSTECPGSRLRTWISNGMPIEEDDVALSDKDVERVADKVVSSLLNKEIPRANPGPGEDKDVAVGSALAWILKHVGDNKALLRDLSEATDQPAADAG